MYPERKKIHESEQEHEHQEEGKIERLLILPHNQVYKKHVITNNKQTNKQTRQTNKINTRHGTTR